MISHDHLLVTLRMLLLVIQNSYFPGHRLLIIYCIICLFLRAFVIHGIWIASKVF